MWPIFKAKILICQSQAKLYKEILFGKSHSSLKDKSGVDKIIVKKQPYQLLNTSRDFFPSFRALKFHKFDD